MIISRSPHESAGAARVAAFAVLSLLVVAVPAAFDPHLIDAFNLLKGTIVTCGALALLTLVFVDCAGSGRRPLWQNGLEFPVAALVGWIAISTAASTNPRASLIGVYMSYDGLVSVAAFAAVFFAIVHFVRGSQVPALLSVFFFGGGGLVILYGAIQLHDLKLAGPNWEFVHWGSAPWRDSSIWSTLGNPSHLGGFLAIMLPVGVALLLAVRSRWAQAATGLMTVALVFELLQTTTRGAWLAAIAGLTVLAMLLAPELRRAPLRSAALGAALLLTTAAGVMLLRSTLDPVARPGWLVDTGSGGSAHLRVEIWRSALQMTRDRPVFGFGPDTFGNVFPAYQTRNFVSLFGPDRVANGAHDLFVDTLATEGIPGLLALVTLLVFAALRSLGAWRRLREAELDDGKEGATARKQRIFLAGIVAGLAAYLVQALLNVDQIALSFSFWVLLALMCVIALEAGVPDVLGVHALVSRTPRPSAHAPAERPPRRSPWVSAGAAGAALVCFAGLTFLVVRPLGADIALYDAVRSEQRASDANGDRAVELRLLASARRRAGDAIAANGWEPSYLEAAARIEVSEAVAGPARAPALIGNAVGLLQRAVRLEPRDPRMQERYATALLRLRKVNPSAVSAERRAEGALHQAIRANPWQPRYPLVLSRLLARRGAREAALAVLDHALRYSPQDPDLLREAAKLASRPRRVAAR